ncbi:aminobenzoyl-glutamate transport protein [Alteromonadaceae bacterium Bs31]|nr:aminobenzoyl-glutamate transport protein [Alteromonadaceae bacterium Bs31]
MLCLSLIAQIFSWSAVHPVSGEEINAVNLLSVHGLHMILAKTVSNFVNFAPVGTVLVAILGIGIAEHSGLLGVALRSLVLRTPKRFLSFVVVLAGVLSSIAADVGYVVLIPLAALIFKSAGRNPLLGIAAAFAGVSGGYSANLLVGPLDALLAGISTEAAQIVEQDYELAVTANYYFMIASTFLVSLVGAWVTDKIVEPRLPPVSSASFSVEALSYLQKKGLSAVALFTFAYIAALLVGLLPESGVLRDPATHSVVRSPFISGVVTVVALYAGIAGFIYGKVSGSYKSSSDAVKGMESNMAAMAGYIVLMFFAAQFVSYFAWSKLGIILAIHGANFLAVFQLPASALLAMLVFLVAFLNLFIGSASAKWALLAPVFVPMLMLLGVPPEATQVAYRVGDSCTNIITPLMPYFGVILAFAQQHQKDVGIGSIAALMLPYSLVFLLVWSVMLVVWITFDIPLGP